MAEAIEEVIPCENCNTSISLHDWAQHSRQCVHGKRNKTKNGKRAMTDESDTDGIPCEYCDVQIGLNDWESHSRQCADAHKRRVEKLKNGFTDEPTADLIPCEYCDAQVSMHELEWHSRQCANSNKRGTTNLQNKNRNESSDEVIPCEYCAAPVSIHDWSWHTKQCAEAERERVETLARRITNESNNDLIPCEYCDKVYALEFFEAHQIECRRKQASLAFRPDTPQNQIAGGIFPLPPHWDHSSPNNLSRYILETDSPEYKFAAEKFHTTLTNNQIVQIERIQNRRWYRQYDAHRDDFIERYDNSTEQWLFHGCKGSSVDAIVKDCFNRSHAVRCAAGQGIYFAAQASTSLAYTQPGANNVRHMFLARVLVGKTTAGNQATRVCPPGFDTTGGGTVFVTYHDAQAYGEYLIQFR